jgi:hypothetical protein
MALSRTRTTLVRDTPAHDGLWMFWLGGGGPGPARSTLLGARRQRAADPRPAANRVRVTRDDRRRDALHQGQLEGAD